MIVPLPAALLDRAPPEAPTARMRIPITRARAPEVLFLTHTGRIGGAETCLLHIVRALGGEVLLFEDGALHARLLDQGSRVTLPRARPDLRAIRRDRGLLRALPALAGIIGLIRHIARLAASRDLVYCNSQKSFVLGALASWLHRTPLLWHLHDILDRHHFGWFQIRLVVGLANRRAERVVVPSKAVADSFIAAGGRRSLVALVRNGVPVPSCPGIAPERAGLRRDLGLPPGFLFGVFSRLAPWKGQHIALAALALLPEAACVIAGDALFGEQDYRDSLRAQASRLGIADRVHFLGHRDDVGMLMRAVDVVVHPSTDPEPFGLTLVEAMLAETPLVASWAGAAAEILDGGRAGILVPPGDALALTTALEQCRSRPEAAARRAALARRHAEQHFNVERLQHDIREVVLGTACGRDPRHERGGSR